MSSTLTQSQLFMCVCVRACVCVCVCVCVWACVCVYINSSKLDILLLREYHFIIFFQAQEWQICNNKFSCPNFIISHLFYVNEWCHFVFRLCKWMKQSTVSKNEAFTETAQNKEYGITCYYRKSSGERLYRKQKTLN